MRRRSFLTGGLSLALGGLLATGSGTGHRPARRSYDPAAIADVDATITAIADPRDAALTGLPAPAADVVADLEARYPSLRLDAVSGLRGSVALDGLTPVAGGLVARGAVDSRVLATDLGSDGATRVGTGSTADDRELPRFMRDSVAVAVADRFVAVGHGPDADAAAAHLDGLLTGTGSPPASQRFGQLPHLLGGSARAYVALDGTTRDAVRAWLADAGIEQLSPVVDAAAAAGVAVEPGTDRTAARLGIVADPDRLSLETLAEPLLAMHERADAVTIGTPSRTGRTIVVDVAVETDSLWSAPPTALGI